METTPTEPTDTSAALINRLDTIARVLILAAVFVLPIVFLPSSVLPLPLLKMGVLSLLVMGALIAWSIARLNEHSVLVARTHVLPAVLLLTLGYAVAAFLSTHVVRSLIGFGFERDTVLSVLTFTAALVAVALTSRRERHILQLQLAFFASFAVFAIIQIARVLFGADTFLPNVFSSNITTTLLGSWNDVAVFSGVVIVMALSGFALLGMHRRVRLGLYVLSALALFLLIVVNLVSVWAALVVASFVLSVYIISDASYDKNSGRFKPRVPLKRLVPSAAVLLLSVVFLLGGTTIGERVSDTFNIGFVDVRPSWEGTVTVASGVYAESPIVGVGPNAFRDAWIAYKPDAVNETTFWNTDFNSGVGVIPTGFVTGGLLVGLLWLLLLGSFIHLGFRLFATRIVDAQHMYLVVSSYMSAAFLWVLAIVYVPQTVMLAYTFLFAGMAVAAAQLAGVVRTREVRSQQGYAPGITLTALVLLVGVTSFVALFVQAERVYASAMLSRAVAAANEGDLDKAEFIAARLSSIGADPRIPQLQTNLGIARLTQILNSGNADPADLQARFQDRLSGTLRSAQQVVAADEDNYRSWLLLGDVYAQLVPLNVEGAYESAQEAYTQALLRNPRGPSIPMNLSRIALLNGDLETARVRAQEALALKRNYTNAHYLISQIEIREGNAQAAIASTESAVLLQPGNAGLLFQLGVLHYSLGNYEQVVPVLERAIAINPRYANALYFLGLSYDQTGNQQGALAAFERIASLNPDNEEVQSIVTALTEGKSALSVFEGGVAPAITPGGQLPVSEAQ